MKCIAIHLGEELGETLLGSTRAHQDKPKTTQKHMQIVNRIATIELQEKLSLESVLENSLICFGKIESVEFGIDV